MPASNAFSVCSIARGGSQSEPIKSRDEVWCNVCNIPRALWVLVNGFSVSRLSRLMAVICWERLELRWVEEGGTPWFPTG